MTARPPLLFIVLPRIYMTRCSVATDFLNLSDSSVAVTLCRTWGLSVKFGERQMVAKSADGL